MSSTPRRILTWFAVGRLLILSTCCLIVWGSLALAQDKQADAPDKPWTTGAKFDWILDQPVVATWQNSELRFAIQSLSDQRRVPMVFDRRLDPNRSFSLQTTTESLRDTYRKLAAQSAGGVSITSQTVYVGPMAAAGKLQTLIALRNEEIQKIAATLPAARKKSLTDRVPVEWHDLDTPREIVEQMARDRGLRVRSLDPIQHDLWVATQLAPIPLAEAFTLVLIQFDLTFQLNPDGSEVELIPIPDQVEVERKWILPKDKSTSITKAVDTEFPELAQPVQPNQLVARGTAEQLEDLDRLIQGMLTTGTPRKKPATVAPLSQRRLTFQAKDAPLSAILNKLSETGIQFEYDRDALKQTGINIDQLVEIDVKAAPPTELFDKLFKPLKLTYKINGLKVSIRAE